MQSGAADIVDFDSDNEFETSLLSKHLKPKMEINPVKKIEINNKYSGTFLVNIFILGLEDGAS